MFIWSTCSLPSVGLLPIINFGKDPIVRDPDTNVVPGALTYPESMLLRLGCGMVIFNWLAPAPIERMNVGLQKRYAYGETIIEGAGGMEAYDRKIREKLKLFSSAIELKRDEAIVFEED